MTGEVINGSATYNLDDDTLRWTPDTRLDASEYAQTKSLGFRWWRSLEAWVATWTPSREAWLLLFVEAVEHESDPDDPSGRIDRFASRAAAASTRANERREAALNGLPPGGQPIQPPGHHSRAVHLRLIKRSDQNMQKAVEEGRKADYWQQRARGTERRAKQKSDPGVIRRRIDKLSAELRGHQRQLAALAEPATPELQAGRQRSESYHGAWIEHLELRLAYEQARLDSLNPAPFAPVTAYKKGDLVIAKRHGRCQVVRVGPKNVRVTQLEGPTRGWEWVVPPHELKPVETDVPSS